MSRKKDLFVELKVLRTIEDQCWKQKTRGNWLREGALNTSLFHRVALGQRRENLITPAMIPMDDNANAATIKIDVSDIFNRCFQHFSGPHIFAWSTEFPRLDMVETESLESLSS